MNGYIQMLASWSSPLASSAVTIKFILLAEHVFACNANVLILLLTIFLFALLYLSQLKGKKKKEEIKIKSHGIKELHQEVIASNAAASLIKELTNILISGARC